jgi:hypothetical protein
MMTPRVARDVANNLGAFTGDSAEIYLAAGVASTRPEGVRWLAHRVYGTSLGDAFRDVFDPAAGSERDDSPELVNALAICTPSDTLADRWLALLALAQPSPSDAARALIATDPSLRRRIRNAFDQPGLPKVLPADVLSEFGRPADAAESSWLVSRYKAAFADAIEGTVFGGWPEAKALETAWLHSFPDEALPLPAEDREIFVFAPRILDNDDDGDEEGGRAPEHFPFRDVAAFMMRHGSIGWALVLGRYAEWGELPSDAVSFPCRSSAAECAEVLRRDDLAAIAGAVDVAPALDLPSGDVALATACDALGLDQSRALAELASGSHFGVAVREAAASCLTVKGADAEPAWRALARESAFEHRWRQVDRVAELSLTGLDEATRSAVLEQVRAGSVRPIEVPWVLAATPEGTELLRGDVRNAFPELDAALDQNDEPSRLPFLAAALRDRLTDINGGPRVLVLGSVDVEKEE